MENQQKYSCTYIYAQKIHVHQKCLHTESRTQATPSKPVVDRRPKTEATYKPDTRYRVRCTNDSTGRHRHTRHRKKTRTRTDKGIKTRHTRYHHWNTPFPLF